MRLPRRSVLGVVCSLLVVLALTPAPSSADPVTGNATYFDGLGSPYGGCGLPQAVIDSQDFVALNVYDTPGDYSYYPRPIPPDQAARIGLYDNGRNCGRFVEVTIGDFCTGVNDGAPNQPFCRNGSWVSDTYNGAKLTMVVADSCGDSNAWCRDDRYHLDLSKPSLNRFVSNGVPVGNLDQHWNNRRISWQFVPAPNYTGDIRIGFLQGAQVWWGAIAISHLPNGIHGVEYFSNGSWQQAQMNSDMGQSYIISGLTTAGRDFRIRVRDVADQPLFGGRVYDFSLPASCQSSCGPAYTEVPYTVTST
ncbi:expansin family protein [Flindersiella endophytica]